MKWDEARARARALGESRPTRTSRVSISDSDSLVLRESVHALLNLPPHAASAMDGWVVAGEPPWSIGAPIDAGHAPDRTALLPGTARPICTGAPLPPGANGVLRLENGQESVRAGWRELHRSPHARADEPVTGEHVRPAGEEATAGELLIACGSLLTPARIALAAAAGHDLLSVAVPPEVDLLVLGDELTGSGVPRPGLIRDVMSPSFPSMLVALGARMQRITRCGDDPKATTAAMASSDADLLIVTGGSSHGRTDHAHGAARELGIDFDVDGVAMRPGHPVAFGSRPDGRIVLLLPGNPLAAIAGLLSFGAPMLAAMLGRTAARIPQVRLSEPASRHHGDTRLVAVAIHEDGARALDLQGSGMLRGLAAADGFAVVHPGSGATGDTVPLLPLPW
jgi:molybdopterin molybdotransferase